MPRSSPRAIATAMLLAIVTNFPVSWAYWPRHSAPLASMFVLGGIGRQDAGAFHDRIVTLELEKFRAMQVTHRLARGFDMWDMSGHFMGVGSAPSKASPATTAEMVTLFVAPGSHLASSNGKTPDPALARPMFWPSWARSVPAGAGRLTCFSTAASGWPVPALAARTWVAENASSREFRGGIRSAVTRPWTDGAIPLTPIWPGFAVNAAAFTLPWWFLIVAPGAFRRAVRRRRGCCPKCAYNLRGQPAPGCPECGWGREPSPTHT